MKNKRVRTIFTPEQLERMEDEFNKYATQLDKSKALQNNFCRTQYMVGHDRVLLASRLNLTEAQVSKHDVRSVNENSYRGLDLASVIEFVSVVLTCWMM